MFIRLGLVFSIIHLITSQSRIRLNFSEGCSCKQAVLACCCSKLSNKLAKSYLSLNSVWFLALNARVSARAFALSKMFLFPGFDHFYRTSQLLTAWQNLQTTAAIVAVNPLVGFLPSFCQLCDGKAVGGSVHSSSIFCSV